MVVLVQGLIAIIVLDPMDKSNKIVFSSFVKAFTLIEIIIVVAIMILFAGLSIGYYNDFTQQKKLDEETSKMIDVLELAKKKTSSGDSSMCTADPQSSARVVDYSVIVNSATTYQLSPNCSVGTPNPINYTTNSNIIFPTVFPVPTSSVQFKTLSAGTTPYCFILKNSSSNKCRYINVEAGGVICEGSCGSCDVCSCPSC